MVLSLALALLAADAQPQQQQQQPQQPRRDLPFFNPAPPAPPAPRAPAGSDAERREMSPEPAIVRFVPGPAGCEDGGLQRPTLAEEPFPGGTHLTGARQWTFGAAEVELHFRIAADGRPLSIDPKQRGDIPAATADVAAAFAAWRFAPGRERAGCMIVFTAEAVPVRMADAETLDRFLVLHALGGAPVHSVGRAAFRRRIPAGSNCFDPPPNVRLQAFPAFEEIPQPPGTASYSMVEYDIAADGSTRGARIAGSSGNRELDRQSLAAIARTRYQPGARTGCTFPFYRRHSEPLRPPPPPEEADFRTAGSTCPERLPDWEHMPALVFPDEFSRRSIEGWAIVRYDVSPKGTTGNVTAVASEPASAFGEQAVRIVSGARKPASTRGHSGCVVRVIFVLPKTGGSRTAPDAGEAAAPQAGGRDRIQVVETGRREA